MGSVDPSQSGFIPADPLSGRFDLPFVEITDFGSGERFEKQGAPLFPSGFAVAAFEDQKDVSAGLTFVNLIFYSSHEILLVKVGMCAPLKKIKIELILHVV
jgi:hypothetical protein